MRHTFFLIYLIFLLPSVLWCQPGQNPIIKDFGGIYDIPSATVKPDPRQKYQIVIDVVSGPELPHQLNPALNNVARMINLHAIGGVPPENLEIVLAIHGDATMAIVNNQVYEKEFEMANPNVLLLEALKQAGVKLAVCGQSLIGRGLDPADVLQTVEIATSMLTTVTTYQMMGFAFLRF
jgi:intracellular sulfur oxidation DsrE/DsrF family protein